mgnify:CR=1 FL=1
MIHHRGDVDAQPIGSIITSPSNPDPSRWVRVTGDPISTLTWPALAAVPDIAFGGAVETGERLEDAIAREVALEAFARIRSGKS